MYTNLLNKLIGMSPYFIYGLQRVPQHMLYASG
jgi:hypothetical protein